MTRAGVRWPAWGLAWVLVSVACIHLFGVGDAPIADDRYFATMLSQYTLQDYLVHRYHTWTGRLPIEAVLVVLVHHTWVWRVLNALMVLLLCHAMGRLARVGTGLSQGGAMTLAFALFVSMTPQITFEAAWWLTGSLNYLWPVALGLWSLVPLLDRTPCGWPQRLGCCLAAMLAAYCDQLALVLVPLTLGLFIWRMRQGRWSGWDLAQVLLLCANAAFALSAPGNAVRYLQEQGMRFPNFADQDVWDKLRIGLGLIGRAFADPRNYLATVMEVLALLLLWGSPLARGLRVVLAVVLLIALAQVLLWLPGVPGQPLYALLPARLDGEATWQLSRYLRSAWAAGSVGALVVACAVAFWPRPREAARMGGVLLLGLASLGMMGFSPTAYLSGMRIAFLCAVAFALVGIRLLVRVPQVHGARAGQVVVALLLAWASWRVGQTAFY